MNKKQKISFILNCLIFVFTVFATISMMIGFDFMSGTRVLSSTSFKAFKYFTVDSNVIAGCVSFFFMHFLTPLLCIITFAFFEPANLSFKESFLGTCFMILYALFYIPNISRAEKSNPYSQ